MQFSDIVISLSNQVEDIVAWLLSKGDELQERPDQKSLQGLQFHELINEYDHHEKFMTKISEYCHTIMSCKQEAQRILDEDEQISDEDRDEIGIQIDAMTVHYDKLKFMITDRLHCLQQILNDRQRSNIDRQEKWLTSVESKLASLDNIGPDYESLQRQIVDINGLKVELEQKQEFLDVISRVILFDDIEIGSSQIKSSSCENIESRLESMNDRWTRICQTVDTLHERIVKADNIWNLLHLEGPQLDSWLGKIKLRLSELSDAIKDLSVSRLDKPFLMKLITRSDKIDAEIKSEQLRYTSLEHRVRSEILKFDDPCSMFVIELEKKLEDMQENWNIMMRDKRNVEFKLQALLNHSSLTDDPVHPIIPIPDMITTKSNNDLRFKPNGEMSPERMVMYRDPFSDHLTNRSSTVHDDMNLSSQLNDSLSDTRALENSSSSQDTKSLLYSNENDNQNQALSQLTSIHDNDSNDENSLTTNLSLFHTGTFYNDPSNNDLEDSIASNADLKTDGQLDLVNDLSIASHDHDGNHNCRVEEWKHSLESFSNWLRDVEFSLGMVDVTDLRFEKGIATSGQTWSKMSVISQVTFIRDTEIRIKSTCQDEFDCLFLQGQQIIEDLMPELGENDLETNLKDILANIEMRYNSVKRCLLDKRRELSDKERWRRLLLLLQKTSQFLITQMGEVVPESEIGVDLITLAQQQDQLIHFKEELEANTALQSCIQESKLFLKLYDMMLQSHGQTHTKDLAFASPTESYHARDPSNLFDIWFSLRDFKDEIETNLDRLRLHYAELLQTIEDRLKRLDEIHGEMHALQHSIQELATLLQMSEILKSGWVALENLSIEELSEQLEDLKLYRERLASVESVHRQLNSIVDWMEQNSAPLSQSNLNRIDELNSIWNSIQSSVEERQKLIEHAFDEQSGSEQKFLAITVSDLSNWERRVATSKVPYFIDHSTGETHWDHPKFTKILDAMNEYKHYVFSAYRTAAKLRTIQKSLGIDRLMLEQLRDILNKFDSSLKASGAEMSSIRVEQVISLLQMIFEHIHTNESLAIDVPVAIDLTLNWLLNLYDATRTGQLSALSLKVGLTLVCCATQEEKYTFMFETISDTETGTVDAKRLGSLFEICTRIPTYLGEGESFSGSDLIQNNVRECLAASKFNPQRPNDLDLNDYLNWLKTEPQFIIWLPVLHRLLISENTTHKQKCKLCGSNPMIGLRYRCQKCLKFSICQKCFLTGRHVYEHFDPDKHPFREYCCPSRMSDQLRDFSKIFRSAFI